MVKFLIYLNLYAIFLKDNNTIYLGFWNENK